MDGVAAAVAVQSETALQRPLPGLMRTCSARLDEGCVYGGIGMGRVVEGVSPGGGAQVSLVSLAVHL